MGASAADLLETWLTELRDALAPRGLSGTLIYDDRFRGDVLVLNLPTAEGLTELVVYRTGKGAVLVFLAENARAARLAASALGGLHQGIKRALNSQRKLVHRIERMAAHLADSFVPRASGYPAALLARMQTLVAAQPMTGVEASFHTREHDEDPSMATPAEVRKRDAKRYLSRYAACIDIGPRKRAVMIHGERFAPLGETAHVLRQRADAAESSSFDVSDAVWLGIDFAIEAPFATAYVVGEMAGAGVETAAEVAAESASCTAGGLDLIPDCDVLDCGGVDCVPDCSP